MNKIILYSTNCPNCKTLETLLNRKGIIYDLQVKEPEEMVEMGFFSAPMLIVNDVPMDFYKAYHWLQDFIKDIENI